MVALSTTLHTGHTGIGARLPRRAGITLRFFDPMLLDDDDDDDAAAGFRNSPSPKYSNRSEDHDNPEH